MSASIAVVACMIQLLLGCWVTGFLGGHPATPQPRNPATMSSWLVLIHQLPPEPSYLRVKVARRLQRIGAVQIKNTVYVLPSSEQCAEDLQWAIAEIREGGGEANLFESRFVDGITDADVEQRFKDERNADYDALIAEIKGAGRRGQGADGVR